MNSSERPLLSAEDACFSFNGHDAVHGLSMELRAGELLAIAGPNGSGKSTLLKLLSGMLAPRAGSISLCGRPLASYSAAERTSLLGVLPSEPENAYRFSVLETVLMGRMLCASWWKDPSQEDVRAAEDALLRVGAHGLGRRHLNAISSGERQRVFLAQALCVRPKILLLDEPTSHLDLKHGLGIMSLLRGISREGLAVACVLHDVNAMSAHCDRVLLMKDGQPVASGPARQALSPENILSAFGLDARRARPEDGTLVFSLPGKVSEDGIA